MFNTRFFLSFILLQYGVIAYGESTEVLEFNLGSETIEGFMEKSRTQGGENITLVKPGSSNAETMSKIFTIYEPEVDVDFPKGMNSNPKVKSISGRFMNSGPLYYIKVTMKGGNELLDVRRHLIKKYPESKNLTTFQKNIKKVNSADFGMFNCNHWMETKKLSICTTNAAPLEFENTYKPDCIGSNGYCPRALYISYSYAPLVKKAHLEYKAKENELSTENGQRNSNGL